MKTILVIYTEDKITSKVEAGRKKKYSFNSNSKLKIGDLSKSDEYDTNMQVVKILPKAYKYYNSATGHLSNDFDSTSQWEIRALIVRSKEEENTVYASIV